MDEELTGPVEKGRSDFVLVMNVFALEFALEA